MGLLRREAGDARLHAEVRAALERLGTMLPLENCAVELVDLSGGVATVRMAGECPHCALNVRSLAVGIEAHLRAAVPQVRAVRFDPPD